MKIYIYVKIVKNQKSIDAWLCKLRYLRISLYFYNFALYRTTRFAVYYTTENFIGEVVPAPYWTIERLSELLKEALEGRTELMCHPGKNMKKDIKTSYLFERETEWRTLMSPETKKLLKDFCLCNFEQAFQR